MTELAMADEPEPPDSAHHDGALSATLFDAQDDVASPDEYGSSFDSLCSLAVEVLAGEGVESGQVDLHLVDVDTMTALNAQHMGGDGPTDVLSFPLDAPWDPDVVDPLRGLGDEPEMIGDLVLCPRVAVDQAPNHAGSIDAEFALLVIHGVLHLLGHDHAEPDETRIMRERERHHLRRRGFEHPEPE